MQDRGEALVPCTPAGVMELLREAPGWSSRARERWCIEAARSSWAGRWLQLLLGAERHRHALPLAHARPAGGVPRGATC